MRKQFFSIFVCFLFLLATSISRAQTISSQKGLTTAVFTTSSGTIKVYLPDDIRQGDVISGRVVAEPEGKNEKQLTRSLAELVKYTIGLNGEKFTVGNAAKTIQFTVPAGRPMENSLYLLNANGMSPVQQLTIPAKPASEQKPAPTQCIIPGHVVKGSPMTIPGPFDGNAATTQCSIGNQPATVLAESPRTSIVAFPANANGMQLTQVQENGQQACSKNVSGVDMNVSAGKLNLTKGENTYIDVSITGLQNLQAPALLILNNLTTDVVALQPSNNIAVPLVPDSVSSGNFNRRFNVQSIRTGGFAVNVNLDFQDIMLTPKPEDPVPGSGSNVPPAADVEKPEQPKIVYDKKNDIYRIPIDSVPEDKEIKACSRSTADGNLPEMDGGLAVGKMQLKQTIKRDDFIALVAEGADYDMFVIQCSPIICPKEVGTVKVVPLSGRVRFEWKIIDGPGKGQFVKLGCLYPEKEDGEKTDGQKTKGEQVIFMPPYVELPEHPNKERSITTEIILSIIDDKESLKDVQVDRKFDIITTRYADNPEVYKIEIINGVIHKLPVPVSKEAKANCKATAGAWDKKTDLTPPKIILPDVPENNKMVLGQWIVLEAENQHETDLLPGITCGTACSVIIPFSKVYEDNLEWEWEVKGTTKGKFAGGNVGRYVIYQLPEKMEGNQTEMELSFRVKVYNPKGSQVPDVNPKSKESWIWSDVVYIKVYQPGVKLLVANPDWVPTDNENKSAEITSVLMINDWKVWKPAPAHTCRIHYFDLFDVSNELGVCLNSPLPEKANYCRDLKIKSGIKHEAYDNVNEFGCPDNAGYFMQARTKKPVRSDTINIYSEDYGSWGMLRSFANVNEDKNVEKPVNTLEKKPGMSKKQLEDYALGLKEYKESLKKYYAFKDQKIKLQLPYYTPIPITSSDVKHPTGPAGRAKYKYLDNRVSIPLDLDSNHIPDKGWKISGTNSFMPDFQVDPGIDNDNEPIGDTWVGDGLSWYEEYRGFMVTFPTPEHHRTNPGKKDLFVDNTNELPLDVFQTITGIAAHQIGENQYSMITKEEFKTIEQWVKTNQRFINFNNGFAHSTPQKGLFLRVEPVSKIGFMGLSKSESDEKDEETPAPPNSNLAVWVDREKIRQLCDANTDDQLEFDSKLRQVVAHELCHALNVYHHGEKDHAPGLTSGNRKCIMRYDNFGGATGEIPGTILCIDEDGANHDHNRGKCALQIRVSGRIQPNTTNGYPVRK